MKVAFIFNPVHNDLLHDYISAARHCRSWLAFLYLLYLFKDHHKLDSFFLAEVMNYCSNCSGHFSISEFVNQPAPVDWG